VLRFGQYARTLGPGLHFKLPRPFETVDMVQTARLRSMAGSVRMLTRDQDLVVVDFSTRYQVLDARRYLYAMDNLEDGIAAAAEAAVRGAVGRQGLEQLLAGSRAALAAEATQALQHSLDGYGAGVRVAGIDVQNIAPPPEIKDAFDDVDKAREDRQGAEDGAHAYADKVLPIARGDAARIVAEATGYKTARIARAQGDAERFGLLLKAYRAAPEVTRRRLWLEMMEDVLAGNAKVIDGRDGRDVINLPPAPLAAPASAPVAPSSPPAGAVAPGDAEAKP
jgi:membrane protease subunit HflK